MTMSKSDFVLAFEQYVAGETMGWEGCDYYELLYELSLQYRALHSVFVVEATPKLAILLNAANELNRIFRPLSEEVTK